MKLPQTSFIQVLALWAMTH